MKVLLILTDGKRYFLDRDIDVNLIAVGADFPGEQLIKRYEDNVRIPGTIKEWEYKTDWEIRDLAETKEGVTEIELYEDYIEPDFEEPYEPDYDDHDMAMDYMY